MMRQLFLMNHAPLMNFSPHLYQTCLALSILAVMSGQVTAQVTELDTLVLKAQQPETTLNLDPFQHELTSTPSSVKVIDQAQIQQQGLKQLSDLGQQDASLGDGYLPIGYYGNLISRGFALDTGSSYLVNGQTVRGEQNIGFENKQRVEVLKGVAALGMMATPGGAVNYVTKRPEDVKSVTLTANEYGQVGAHLDVGGFSQQQENLGYRINLATEKLKPYIQEADGERYFASLALDYVISDQHQLSFDAEWQQQSQYSVAGYQLFNGRLPTQITWDRALGQQAWSKPVRNDSISTQLNYQYLLASGWQADVNASFSQVVVDDYSSFPWGCYSDVCQIDGLGNQFDATGHYDLYDFQSPNDTRRTAQLQTSLRGSIHLNDWQHDLNLSWQYQNKRQQQHEPINVWVGVGHATQPNIAVPAAQDAVLSDQYTALKSQQHALTLMDQLRWHPQWSALVGVKWLYLDEQSYAATGAVQRDTQTKQLLPQVALMYQPMPNAQAYLSYREGLSDGAVAPWYAENALMSLAPRQSRQYELGFKQQHADWSWNMAIFALTQDYQYAKAVADQFWFVNQGEQQSRGIELAIESQITECLRLAANGTWLDAKVTGVTGFGQQMQNVPKWRAVLQADYQVPQVEGLKLDANLRYSASKFADKAATVQAPSYSVIDLGASYAFKVQGYPVQSSIRLENVFNKQYWRDVGDYMGDDYLFLGNPRTFKLATTLQF